MGRHWYQLLFTFISCETENKILSVCQRETWSTMKNSYGCFISMMGVFKLARDLLVQTLHEVENQCMSAFNEGLDRELQMTSIEYFYSFCFHRMSILWKRSSICFHYMFMFGIYTLTSSLQFQPIWRSLSSMAAGRYRWYS
jgi:hypothetical protein